MHRAGGTVADADGEPLNNVWVDAPGLRALRPRPTPTGASSSTALTPGRHRLLARTADGREASADLEVPGALLDLVLDGGKAAAGGRKSGKRG